ncbi:MAG: TauD/TfdA family dioxygenase [Pseudomonadota bacterium]
MGVQRNQIDDAAGWTGESLRHDASWRVTLSNDARDDLLRALDSVHAKGLELVDIDRSVFPLPHCAPVIDHIAQTLRRGCGFALLHGFPVEGLERTDIEKLYWLLCGHLGTGVTQNSDATLIHYVTEGKLRPNQGTRGVGNPGPVSLHVDLADIVSLLCVRQAADSPPSRLASSVTLHNILAERDPAGLERLYEGFVWDRQNEHASDESPTTGYRVPMFSQHNRQLSCRYNRNWITKAIQRDGRDFTAEEVALLDAVDTITHETCIEFDFQPGDVQFANNYVVLHGRAPHSPAISEESTRLLMRIWFNMDDIREFADEAIVRHGILRHGNLGWTARELAAGLADKRHSRRSDGAPIVHSH